ncbi:hypothetical protein LQZ18_13945 [Lachnospiraceae bacterium ZAX-1]
MQKLEACLYSKEEQKEQMFSVPARGWILQERRLDLGDNGVPQHISIYKMKCNRFRRKTMQILKNREALEPDKMSEKNYHIYVIR